MTKYSYNIDAENVGQRLDNFLVVKLKKLPKSALYRLIRKGAVRVNGKRVKPLYRLEQKDLVYVPDVNLNETVASVAPSKELLATLSKRILYEDAKILAINKPAGLAVHKGSGLNAGLIDAIKVLRPELKYLSLAHRLDKATSGCLLLAKKLSTLRKLHELLRNRQIDKVYYALTLGNWNKTVTHVNLGLCKNVLSSGERIVKVSTEGKSAHTEFHAIERFEIASLVKIILHTGRTHQIRVHAKSVGHHLAGDEKYGDKAFNKILNRAGLKRLFLHASKLSFIHPSTGEKTEIHAPLDNELQKILLKLRGQYA